MRLLYDAPHHHRLLPDSRGGRMVHGGETFDVDDPDRAMELLTDPHTNLVEVPIDPDPTGPTDNDNVDITRLSRKELDEVAEQAGIDPSGYRTKQDLIDVLTGGLTAAEETEPEPEAEGGEGHETPQED